MIPKSLWAVTGLWTALLLGASLVWPIGTGLDEPSHVDMAYEYAAHPFTFYGPGQLQYTYGGSVTVRAVPSAPSARLAIQSGSRLAQTHLPPRSQRPTFLQLGGYKRLSGAQPNQMVEHPPLYYWLEAAVISLPGVSHLAWDLQVWLMRLLSVLIVVPIPLLCWGTTRRLIRSSSARVTEEGVSRYALLGAILPLTIPDLIRDSSSVDNDALLFLTTSVTLYGLARVLSGDFRLRTAVIISVAIAAALWTKGFALTLPPIALIAYIVGGLSAAGRGGFVRTVWKPVLLVAAGSVVGGLWWLRNLIDYHTVQPDGFGAYKAVIRGYVDDKGTIEKFLPSFLDQFLMRIWGEIGLPDLPSPGPVLIYGWLTVVGIAVVAALCVRSGRTSRRSGAVIALVPLAYVAIDMDGSYVDFHKWSHDGIQAAQGRYLYGGIVAVSALFAVGSYKLLRPRLQAPITLIVLAGALLTNAVSWWLVLRSWYQSSADQSYGAGTIGGIRTLFRWSPLPEGLTIVLVLLLPLLAASATLVALIIELRHRILRPAAPVIAGEGEQIPQNRPLDSRHEERSDLRTS